MRAQQQVRIAKYLIISILPFGEFYTSAMVGKFKICLLIVIGSMIAISAVTNAVTGADFVMTGVVEGDGEPMESTIEDETTWNLSLLLGFGLTWAFKGALLAILYRWFKDWNSKFGVAQNASQGA